MMKQNLIIAITFLIGMLNLSAEKNTGSKKMNAHNYSFKSLDGTKTVSLSEFKGKKILIVNTASQCGYTRQYEDLEKLSKQYAGKLVVVGFPTNDFGGQEPGSNAEIGTFCKKNYGVSFPMSQKITVQGSSTDPLYTWLMEKSKNGKMDSKVEWNFQKYLIDENGNLIEVFPSKVKPMDAEIIGKL